MSNSRPRSTDMNLRTEPGWAGQFTRDQVPGALANGTRIHKVVLEPGDAHPIGTMGTVLGSMAPPEPIPKYEHVRCFYFVEWDVRPRLACAVVDYKIAAVES